MKSYSIALCSLICATCVGLAISQDKLVEPKTIDDGTSSTLKITTPRTARALIICGLMGDDDHRKLYAEVVERLYTGLTTHHGFAPENVTLYWSDAVPEDAGPALKASRGPATREAIENAAAELTSAAQASDAAWVFVLGHAHYDGRYSWLNIPEADIHHLDFGKLFAGLHCHEQVFFMTTSVSGFYHKSLAARGRVVITATEPDFEVNETLFPQHLAKTLAEPPPFKDLDVDEDGKLTLLDAYLYTTQKVAEEYTAGMLLATEHALLDDTGDAKPTELQANYLIEELGGRYKPGKAKPILRSGDGALARQILLDYPPSPPAPDETPLPEPTATPKEATLPAEAAK
jgi:hypothetical protein